MKYSALGYYFGIVCSFLLAVKGVSQDNSEEEFPDSALLYIQKDSLYQFRTPVKVHQRALDGFQNYMPLNGINLGNSGTAFYPFERNFQPHIGFNLGLGAYNRRLPEEVNSFWVNMPFTRGKAVLGSKREQHLNAFHTQNIKKSWNVSLEANHLNSKGFYKRQRAKGNYVNLGVKHFSLNKFYEFRFNYLLSNYSIEENGGLNDPLDLATNSDENRELFEVKYDTAGTPIEVSNFGESRSIRFKQYLNFGNTYFIKNDSVIGFTDPKQRVFLDANLSKSYYKYNEANAKAMLNLEVYDTNYIDSVATADVSTIYNDKLRFGFETLLHKDRQLPLAYSLAMGFENGKLNQNDSILIFENFSVEGGLIFVHSEVFKTGVEAVTVFKGQNSGEYKLSYFGELVVPSLKSKIHINLAGLKKQQDYFLLNCHTNHYRWNNSFDFRKNISLKARVENSVLKTALIFGWDKLDNYVYFNEKALPTVFNSTLNIYTVRLRSHLNWGKVNLNSDILYTYLSKKKVLPLPEISVFSSLYFQADLFKKVARIQIGSQVKYYTSFYAGYYNPSINTFTNQLTKKYGNYPYLDFFINARVKKVKVFFKVEHANAGVMGYDYFTFPNRPYHDRSLILGVEWIFLK